MILVVLLDFDHTIDQISLAMSTSLLKELDETMEKLKVVVEDRSLAPI